MSKGHICARVYFFSFLHRIARGNPRISATLECPCDIPGMSKNRDPQMTPKCSVFSYIMEDRHRQALDFRIDNAL